MSDRLIGGLLVQSWTPEADEAVFGGPLASLKVLNTALDAARIRRFADRNPGAHVVYRLVAGDDLGGLMARTAQSIRDTDQLAFLGSRLLVEVPINEAYQAGTDLNRLSDGTIQAVALLRGAGRRPITLNFSVGNPQLAVAGGARLGAGRPEVALATPAVKRAHPPAIVARRRARSTRPQDGEWARVAPAVQATIDADGAVGLHEYGVPGPTWLDGWLNGRFERVRDELLALGIRGARFWIGEHGIDHGVLDGRLGGYRDAEFHLDGAGYGALLARSFARYALAPDVLGVSVFLCGAL